MVSSLVLYLYLLILSTDSKTIFNDPLFPRQWHLLNHKVPGSDLNVLPIWKAGISGHGVTVCIIDDGVDYSHADLRDAFRAELSFDFNTGENLPVPDANLNDHHGTRCAGLIAAKANNGVCGVGIAYNARISAIRILSMNVQTKNEAAAVTYKYHDNHIYSCSWGPPDDGRAVDAPAKMVLEAFADGIVNGRSGRGSVYVFAAGNGKSTIDCCNYDGYANGIFSITVGAIDEDDRMPLYMEPCSAQLICAYSSNLRNKIATTDLGNNQCTLNHGGTSASAPMVSGIIALALSVRPDLTMEQIREALVYTAVPINTRDPTWIRNDVGLMYSYKFGFGKIDATAFVQYAIKMKKLDRRPPGVRSLPRKIVLKESHQFSDETTIDENLFKMAKLGDIYRLEHVTVMMNIECPLRGELKIYIQSPCGTRILLASRRPLDDSSEGLKDWTMMTPGFWGEKINGTWTFILKYRGPGYATLIDYRMAFWGPLKAGINNQNFVDDLVNQYYPPTKDFFDFELAINSPAKGFDRREMVSINRSFDSDGYQDDRLVGEDFYAAVFTIISAAYLWIYPKFLFK